MYKLISATAVSPAVAGLCMLLYIYTWTVGHISFGFMFGESFEYIRLSRPVAPVIELFFDGPHRCVKTLSTLCTLIVPPRYGFLTVNV